MRRYLVVAFFVQRFLLRASRSVDRRRVRQRLSGPMKG
jgi:hypothetical protein